MILDGVVDPTVWISYKVTLNATVMGISSHLPHQLLRSSLVDTEATCFGLADACVTAGRAGCKLMEFVPNATTEAEMAALLTGAHDVTDFPRRWVAPTDPIFTLAGPQALSYGG